MTVRRVVVEFLDDAAFQSVESLPEPDRSVAWQLLDHLRRRPFFGKPLDHMPATGDLSMARSLYVIDFEEQRINHPPPYRIVYRLIPRDTAPERAQVIWAGLRHDLEVYRVAAERIRRAATR